MKREPPTQGFTLVEVLVAMVLTALIAGLMLSVTSGTLTLWRRAQATFDAEAQARVVFDLVERDLQAAVVQSGGGAWMALDIVNTPALLSRHGWLIDARMKPGSAMSRDYIAGGADASGRIADARFGLSGVWLRLITTNVEAGSGSLPVAVGYQICRRPLSGDVTAANPAAVRYSLFRAAVGSSATFVSGYDVLAADYGSTTNAPAETRKPRALTNPGKVDVLATNVVDFGLWLYRRDASAALERIFPSVAEDDSHVVNSPASAPEVADVMIRLLTEEGAQAIAALERGETGFRRPAEFDSDEAWWWAVAQKHSRVFVRRIELKGGRP